MMINNPVKKIGIVYFMMITMIFIFSWIPIEDYVDTAQLEMANRCESALRITDNESFSEALQKGSGDAFVYGTVMAVNPVSYPDISGEYIFIEQITEKYVEHIRGGYPTVKWSEWTWEEAGRESKQVQELSFCGVNFPLEKFTLPDPVYIGTVQVDEYTKHIYYARPIGYTGSMFTYLSNGTIQNNTRFFDDCSVEDVFRYYTFSRIWVFRIIWAVIMVAFLIVFYCWLEDYLQGI